MQEILLYNSNNGNNKLTNNTKVRRRRRKEGGGGGCAKYKYNVIYIAARPRLGSSSTFVFVPSTAARGHGHGCDG
jgi:hypothetical protein